MTVSYVIGFQVREGQVERFLGLLEPVLDAMRNEANFREAILHRDPQDGQRFLLYETWADHQDVLDIQLARPYRAAWHAALPDLLSSPRDISLWTPLRADRSA